MTRRCTHCSHNGHNSCTCPNRGVKLFVVRLIDGSIWKSASMGNLSHYMGGGCGGGSGSGSGTPQNGAVHGDSPTDTLDHPFADGYVSKDFVAGSSSSRERKKGFDFDFLEKKYGFMFFGLFICVGCYGFMC